MKTPAWQSDLERYDFRHKLALQYAHLDIIRHVNNVAIHGLHLEARIRYQLAAFGSEHLYSDGVLLRPRRTVSHFLKEMHFPDDVICATRLIAFSSNAYRIVTGLFQLGKCVSIQHCLMGAWRDGGWVSLPAEVHTALASQQGVNDVPVGDWPPEPPPLLPGPVHPAQNDISARYGDLDPDAVIGELAVSRYIEQSRGGLLRSIKRGPSTGMLVASVDQKYHRWHYGLSNIRGLLK